MADGQHRIGSARIGRQYRTLREGKHMREQLQSLRLAAIAALSVACMLATAPVLSAFELTAPVVTSTGPYEGLINFQELPGGPPSGVNAFLGIRYTQAP